jgi:GT2 family glycosyltransferase
LARNAGTDIANGQWLGFPDDDCWYEPDSLERIMERSERADTPQGVICQWVEQNEVHPAGLLSWKRSSRFRDYPVSSITLFIRRKLIRDVGGFDGRLGIGQWFGAGEETDIVLRALRTGALIAHEPSAKIHHRVVSEHDPCSQIARRSALLRARGTGAMYAKHKLPLWVIIRGLFSPLIKPLAKGHLGAEFKQGIAITLGRLTGWIHWYNQQRQSRKIP